MERTPIPTPTSGVGPPSRAPPRTRCNPPRRRTRLTRVCHPRPFYHFPTPDQAGRVLVGVEQPAPAKTPRLSTPFVLRCSSDSKAVQSVLGNHVSVSPGLSGTECTIVVEGLLGLQITTTKQYSEACWVESLLVLKNVAPPSLTSLTLKVDSLARAGGPWIWIRALDVPKACASLYVFIFSLLPSFPPSPPPPHRSISSGLRW